MSKKILITGGTGLIGSQLTFLLQKKGYQVAYLTRGNNQLIEKRDLTCFKWDIHENKIDEKAFENVYAIVHLAGANIGKLPWNKAYKKEILNSRILSINLLAKYVRKHQIKHFISTSAIGIYEPKSENWIDEKSSLGHNFLAEVCKRWEESLEQLPLDTRKVIIRVGIVLSQSGGIIPNMLKPIRFGLGARLGSGRQYISWIHIHDIARLFFEAIDNKNWEGVYNGVASNPISNFELTKLLAKTCNRPLLLPAIPNFILRLLFGEASDILIDSLRVRSCQLDKMGFRVKFENSKMAIRDCCAS